MTLWVVYMSAANYCGFTQPDVNHLLRERRRRLPLKSDPLVMSRQKLLKNLITGCMFSKLVTSLKPVYRLTGLPLNKPTPNHTSNQTSHSRDVDDEQSAYAVARHHNTGEHARYRRPCHPHCLKCLQGVYSSWKYWKSTGIRYPSWKYWKSL